MIAASLLLRLHLHSALSTSWLIALVRAVPCCSHIVRVSPLYTIMMNLLRTAGWRQMVRPFARCLSGNHNPNIVSTEQSVNISELKVIAATVNAGSEARWAMLLQPVTDPGFEFSGGGVTLNASDKRAILDPILGLTPIWDFAGSIRGATTFWKMRRPLHPLPFPL